MLILCCIIVLLPLTFFDLILIFLFVNFYFRIFLTVTVQILLDEQHVTLSE